MEFSTSIIMVIPWFRGNILCIYTIFQNDVYDFLKSKGQWKHFSVNDKVLLGLICKKLNCINILENSATVSLSLRSVYFSFFFVIKAVPFTELIFKVLLNATYKYRNVLDSLCIQLPVLYFYDNAL